MHVWDAGAGCIECAAEVCVDEFREILVCRVCDRDCGGVYTRAVEEVVKGGYLLGDEVGTVCGRRDVEFAVGVFWRVCSCWFEIVHELH